MPRTFLTPRDPPIDWLKAAFLERKQTRHMTFDDLAIKTSYSSAKLKRMFDRPTAELNDLQRFEVGKALGLTKSEVRKIYIRE